MSQDKQRPSFEVDQHGTLIHVAGACPTRPPCWDAVTRAHAGRWGKQDLAKVQADLCVACGGTREYPEPQVVALIGEPEPDQDPDVIVILPDETQES